VRRFLPLVSALALLLPTQSAWTDPLIVGCQTGNGAKLITSELAAVGYGSSWGKMALAAAYARTTALRQLDGQQPLGDARAAASAAGSKGDSSSAGILSWKQRHQLCCAVAGTYVITEADTCQKYVLPKLNAAGWDTPPHSFTEQKTFTDGRIVMAGSKVRRRPQKRADYLLRYMRDFPIAVVEAKPAYKLPGDGLQQAKDYAEILGLKFAYATNGHGIVEFDYLTGTERDLVTFPTPTDLWSRLRATQGITDEAATSLLAGSYHQAGRSPRYYQEIAINRVVQAIGQGKRRVLLVMAAQERRRWLSRSAGSSGTRAGTARASTASRRSSISRIGTSS
jgi:hypothetical protein